MGKKRKMLYPKAFKGERAKAKKALAHARRVGRSLFGAK